MDFLVFADDATGAFDIATNGRAYKRPVKVIWEKKRISSVDEDLIFCTETRDKNEVEAERIMREISTITKESCSPKLIYMKVDSLLRGNIIKEIMAIDSVYEFDYVVIDVAYPCLGRTVEEGEVLINGEKIENTDIVCDINAPLTSNGFVNDLNTVFHGKVQCLKYYEEIEKKNKILFFDTVKEENFIQIIQKIKSQNGRVLWVGSIGLYTALLSVYYEARKVFCVIGSVSDISKKQIINAQRKKTALVKVDTYNEQAEYYVQQILSLMKSGKNVILYSERINSQNGEEVEKRIEKICKSMSDIASEVMEKEKGINMIVSGGETAMRLLTKKTIININIIGEIEKSVPILEVQEENSNNYVVAIKSGRVGDEQALLRYIEFMRMYAIASK